MSDQQNLQSLRQKNNNSYMELEHDIHPESNSLQPAQEKGANKCENDGCGHDHGPKKQGHEGQKHGSHAPKVPGQKNYGIIFYTIFTCLSCLYLETQQLNPLIGDFKAQLMTYLCYFNVFMCLWSYIQTIRINSHVDKLQEKDPKPYNLDYTKRCDKCNYWKGPRYSHCSSCGKCIYKLDHHCMWTQTCIGHCNQRPFYLFCFYMTIGVFQFWYSTARVFAQLNANCNFFGQFEPGIYILWALTCFSAGVVGLMIVALCFGHTLFVSTNFTTLQSMKARRPFYFPFIEFRRSYFSPEAINPWDRGEIQNLKSLFGTNILTFWMPLGRQVMNEHVFEPMSPYVETLKEKVAFPLTKNEIETLVKGKKLRVNDKIIEV